MCSPRCILAFLEERLVVLIRGSGPRQRAGQQRSQRRGGWQAFHMGGVAVDDGLRFR